MRIRRKWYSWHSQKPKKIRTHNQPKNVSQLVSCCCFSWWIPQIRSIRTAAAVASVVLLLLQKIFKKPARCKAMIEFAANDSKNLHWTKSLIVFIKSLCFLQCRKILSTHITSYVSGTVLGGYQLWNLLVDIFFKSSYKPGTGIGLKNKIKSYQPDTGILFHTSLVLYWIFKKKLIWAWFWFWNVFGLGIGYLRKNQMSLILVLKFFGLGIGSSKKKFIWAWFWYWNVLEDSILDYSITSWLLQCLRCLVNYQTGCVVLPSGGHKKTNEFEITKKWWASWSWCWSGFFFFPILLGSQLVIIHKKI